MEELREFAISGSTSLVLALRFRKWP
jgi:hypothetical protein